jgi:hypothetical protein
METFDTTGRFPTGPTHYYENGYFHVFSDNNYYFKDTTQVFSDFLCEVKTEFINGSVTEKYGLIFRAAFDTVRYYEFTITADGKYSLMYRNDKEQNQTNKILIQNLNPDSVIQKKGVNILKVHCIRDSIHLFINQQRVHSIRDKSLSKGFCGLVVYDKVHVHFDDYIVALKPFKNKYPIQPAIIDSAYHLPNDVLTKVLYNFTDDQLSWDNEPLYFYERGFYKILKVSNYKSFPVYTHLENFVYLLNIRILNWDSSGSMTLRYHKGKYSHEHQGLIFQRDSTVRYFNDWDYANSQSLSMKIPFEYDSGVVQRIKLESQDTDFKLTINGVERVIIIDETMSELMSGYFEIGVYGIKMDILSLKINKTVSEDYGLQSTMPTCAVYRVNRPQTTTHKPYVPSYEKKNPVLKFLKKLERDMDEWFWVTLAGLTMTVIWFFVYTIIRIKRNRFYKTHFESMFLKRIALSNGSMKLMELAKYFHLSAKKTLYHIDQIADKHHIIKQMIGSNDPIIEVPELMIVIPEMGEPVLIKISGLKNMTSREAKEDFLSLLRIASVNHNQLTVDILQKEYHAQPNRIHFLKNNLSPNEPFEKIVKQLLYTMIDHKNIIKESAGEDAVIQIKPDFVNAVIELNK